MTPGRTAGDGRTGSGGLRALLGGSVFGGLFTPILFPPADLASFPPPQIAQAGPSCYRQVTMAPRLPAPRRRRQLLDVALDRFAAKGFHATSMGEIADAAGVTKPVLYQHFHSKRQLYLELLDDVGGQLMEAIGKATAGAQSPHRQVEAGFAAYVGFMLERSQAFPLLFGGGARRDPEFADAVRRVEESIAEAVASLIEADVDPGHRQVLAYAIVGMAEGVLRHWHAARSPVDADRLVRQMADLAWAGLRGVRRV